MTERRQPEPQAGSARRWLLAAAGALGAGLIVWAALGERAPPHPSYVVEERGNISATGQGDPHRDELARCRMLSAEREDPACQALWEANRRRFMGEREPRPASPDVAAPGDAPASSGER